MKIGIFAYNFKHWKTSTGLNNLCIHGIKPDVIFAADRVDLGFEEPKVRIDPKGLFLPEPKQVAEYHGIDYHIVEHNAASTASLIEQYDLDLGVILGARILKPNVIDAFKCGVLNLHPGILPENRGLDTIKWAITKNLPMGVTAHLIDRHIDRGHLLEARRVEVYEDDTMLDIKIRLQNLEQELMISWVQCLAERTPLQRAYVALPPWAGGYPALGQGNYHGMMPAESEANLDLLFEMYKKRLTFG